MQNYQNFIDELFRLDIDTVQYFVKDGQVLHPRDHHPLPGSFTTEQLTNTPADSLPGYVSTYMSLDRYDDQKPENGYADTLVELQRRAITDLLQLEPAQINRHLSNARSKREDFRRLAQKAGEYHKAWLLNTLDQLPSLFLELSLLRHFTGTRPANDSPHSIFVEQLLIVIEEKKGILSGFIEQIENTLQPAPATSLPDSDRPRKNRLVSNSGFDTYIVEKHRAKLMPYLMEQYKGMMPKDIVPMLYALEKLEMLTIKVIDGKIDLRSALIKTFGRQLQDSALKASIPTYDPGEKYPDAAKQQKIEQHRQEIDLHMKGKTA